MSKSWYIFVLAALSYLAVLSINGCVAGVKGDGPSTMPNNVAEPYHGPKAAWLVHVPHVRTFVADSRPDSFGTGCSFYINSRVVRVIGPCVIEETPPQVETK